MVNGKQKDDPLKNEPLLKMHLDAYQVEVPDIPMKKMKFSRFVGYLASPASNPFEGFIGSNNGILKLVVSPLIVGVILMLIQLTCSML